MMKKIFWHKNINYLSFLLLTLFFAFSLAACSKGGYAESKAAPPYEDMEGEYPVNEESEIDIQTNQEQMKLDSVNGSLDVQEDRMLDSYEKFDNINNKSISSGFNRNNQSKEITVSKTKLTKDQQVEKQKEAKRKRVYSGYALMTVKDIDQSKDDIQKYTEEIEGYVESIYGNTVSIRVPVAKFDEAFRWILKLGKVEDKSIETQDVTEAYGDLRNRLDIARNSRTRLYALLTQTTDVKERVRILKEIGRLSEEIELMESTFAMLEQLIAFSRISVDLQQEYDNDNIKINGIPFPWIQALKPFNPSRKKLLAKVDFELGDNFAEFKGGKIYSAESSTGVRFRVSTASNHPKGDAAFWQKALVFHLKDLYASTEEISLKTSNGIEVRGALFTSRDSEPFLYFVGVVEDNRVIHIVEIFSPKGNRNEVDSVLKAVEKGRID